MSATNEGAKNNRGSNKTYVEIEPGHRVRFVIVWLGGTKSFKTIEALREWLKTEMIKDIRKRMNNFTEYEISRVETFALERRFNGGIPSEVYRPEKVDGAVPEG